MENIHLNEVSEIIYNVIVLPKKTIQYISERTGISRDVVRHILFYFYEYPFGGIIVNFEGIPRNIDPLCVDSEIFDASALWSIDVSGMDSIPVENLNDTESYILFGLLNGLSGIDFKALPIQSNAYRNINMMTKGMDRDTGKIFDFKQYPIIKKALINRCSLYFRKRDGEISCSCTINPLGIIYQSEIDRWYIIGLDIENQIHTYDIEEMCSIQMGNKFKVSEKFDLRNHLRAYFSLDNEAEEFVEIVFLDEANVLEKAQRRLQGKGSFLPVEDGALLFAGKLKGMKGLRDWLLGFGSSVEVRKPERLRQEVIRQLRGIVMNYGEVDEQISASHN